MSAGLGLLQYQVASLSSQALCRHNRHGPKIGVL